MLVGSVAGQLPAFWWGQSEKKRSCSSVNVCLEKPPLFKLILEPFTKATLTLPMFLCYHKSNYIDIAIDLCDHARIWRPTIFFTMQLCYFFSKHAQWSGTFSDKYVRRYFLCTITQSTSVVRTQMIASLRQIGLDRRAPSEYTCPQKNYAALTCATEPSNIFKIISI